MFLLAFGRLHVIVDEIGVFFQADRGGQEEPISGAAYERTRDGLMRQCDEQKLLINKVPTAAQMLMLSDDP